MVRIVRAAVKWIDDHPRTGWYLVVITTLHVVLDVVQRIVGG